MRAARVSLMIAMIVAQRAALGQERPTSNQALVPSSRKSEGKAGIMPAQNARVVPPARLNDRPEDEQAIRATAGAFVRAYNSGDAKALAALFAPDSEVIDEYGDRIVGRDRIEDGYSELFDLTPRSKLELITESLRLVGTDTAKEEGQIRLEAGNGGPLSQRRVCRLLRQAKWNLAIHVRQGRP